jgi:hypothetical protein
MGEFKQCELAAGGRRVWIRHMPDAPLVAAEKVWQRVERVFAPLLQARDADTGYRVRVLLSALVRARREYTYEIDAVSLMLASADWIPLDGVHEIPLVQALVEQRRRFVKPLRYDARSAAAFANALLVDVGAAPVALHLVSSFMTRTERSAKEQAICRAGTGTWVWNSGDRMPAFPEAAAHH